MQITNVFLSGYYFYRPLQLILPWLPLVPVVAVATFYVDAERREANMFFGLAILVTTILFSFGSQQRYFYMLPVLPIVCLLVGRGLTGARGKSLSGGCGRF